MAGPSVWNAATLPADDNVNPYVFSVALDGQWFVSKGAMLADYGDVRFEPVTAYASAQAWVAARFSSPVYVQDWVIAEGRGKVLLGDRHFDLNSYTLDAGNLTIKAGNLLAFSPQLELKQSIVPGFVTLLGSGTFIASSNGPVIFVEPPFRADPDALLGWADCPSPSVHHDTRWMAQSMAGLLQGALGRSSGGGAAVRLHRRGHRAAAVLGDRPGGPGAAPAGRVPDRAAHRRPGGLPGPAADRAGPAAVSRARRLG